MVQFTPMHFAPSLAKVIRYCTQSLVPTIFLWCTISCSDSRQSDLANDFDPEVDLHALSYEGDVLFDSGKYLHLAVDLFPSGDAGGEFQVIEYVRSNDISAPKQTRRGVYDVYHNGSEQMVVILQRSALEQPLRRSSLAKNGMIRTENFRGNDLTFLLHEDRLELLDGDDKVSNNPEDFLYKRTTPEFTIEGYLMYFHDTAWIYETNTEIKWPLSKLGSFYQVARERNILAKKKYDTTYLRATGYCIESVVKEGQRRNVLVLKKVIQSSISR
jgi:hypothetical protein